MSQMELAAQAGISQSIITKLERGKIQGRIREQQDAIAKALGITVADLCGEVPPAAESARPPPRQDLSLTPLSIDDVLIQALDKTRHTLSDIAAVRAMVAPGDTLTESAARQLLDAAAALRSRGQPATPAGIALEIARRVSDAEAPVTRVTRRT